MRVWTNAIRILLQVVSTGFYDQLEVNEEESWATARLLVWARQGGSWCRLPNAGTTVPSVCPWHLLTSNWSHFSSPQQARRTPSRPLHSAICIYTFFLQKVGIGKSFYLGRGVAVRHKSVSPPNCHRDTSAQVPKLKHLRNITTKGKATNTPILRAWCLRKLDSKSTDVFAEMKPNQCLSARRAGTVYVTETGREMHLVDEKWAHLRKYGACRSERYVLFGSTNSFKVFTSVCIICLRLSSLY